MSGESFETDVRKAFSSVHSDMQNLRDLFDKLNKKVDIIGEQVDMLKSGIQSSTEGEDAPSTQPEDTEDDSDGTDDGSDLYGPK